MIKKFLSCVFAFLLFASKTLLAQEICSFSINAGFGIPMGKFAKTEIDPNNLGFALPTIYNEIQIKINCSPRINLVGLISHQMYDTDATTLSENLLAKYNIPQGIGGINASSNWDIKELSIGGGYKLVRKRKLQLEANLYVGYLIAKSPDILHLVYGGGWIAQENNKSHSLSTRIGLGCTYRPTKFPVFVSLSSDYINAKALFNNLNVTQSDGSMVKYSINQPLNRLLISLGLGFYINRVD